MAQAKNQVEAVVDPAQLGDGGQAGDERVPVVKLSRVERLQQELREAEEKQQARGLKKLSALQEQRAGYQTRAAQLQEKIADLDAQIEQAKAELPIITDGVGQLPPVDYPEVEESDSDPEDSDAASDQVSDAVSDQED